MDSRGALTGDERAELERLRAEVATLRVQVRQPELPARDAVTGRAVRQRWRTVVAALLTCSAVCWRRWPGWRCGPAPGHRHRPVRRHREPPGQRPGHPERHRRPDHRPGLHLPRREGADRPGGGGSDPAGNLPPQVAGQLQALSTPIANGVQSFTRTQVGRIVQSPAFADAWVQANRLAHQELVDLPGCGAGLGAAP
jgi:hypothetical protein